jgi:hypothetical protein
MQFVLQIALDVGNFCYTHVAQVCLNSRRWQNSGMIVAKDPECNLKMTIAHIKDINST